MSCATYETGPMVSDIEQQKTAAILKQKAELYRLEQKQRIIFIGQRLLSQIQNPPIVTFELMESDEINAFAARHPNKPNEYLIAVSRGMLRFVKSNDELAVVLGHELAHIAKGHIQQTETRVTFGALLGAIAGGLLFGTEEGAEAFAELGANIGATMHSQDQEREADFMGLTYVYKAGYDSEAGMRIWERFAIELPESINKQLMSTHPASPERMLRLQKIAQELKTGSVK
jgi:predicted Zn-dependent protease